MYPVAVCGRPAVCRTVCHTVSSTLHIFEAVAFFEKERQGPFRVASW